MVAIFSILGVIGVFVFYYIYLVGGGGERGSRWRGDVIFIFLKHVPVSDPRKRSSTAQAAKHVHTVSAAAITVSK